MAELGLTELAGRTHARAAPTANITSLLFHFLSPMKELLIDCGASGAHPKLPQPKVKKCNPACGVRSAILTVALGSTVDRFRWGQIIKAIGFAARIR
jgi:hypothetical protein